MIGEFNVTWVDGGREPQNEPDPAYPDGIDLDVTDGTSNLPICTVQLPYPARRCGHHDVTCRTCGRRVLVTTAGRADDPRSLTLRCNERKG